MSDIELIEFNRNEFAVKYEAALIPVTREVLEDADATRDLLDSFLNFDWQEAMRAQADDLRLTLEIGPRHGPGRNELFDVQQHQWRVRDLRDELDRIGRHMGRRMGAYKRLRSAP